MNNIFDKDYTNYEIKKYLWLVVLNVLNFRRCTLKTVTVRLPDQLHKDLKIKMAQEEMTMQNHIITLLTQDLEKRKQDK